MLKALNRPLPLATALFAAAGLIAAVTVYCLAYTSLSGRPESPIEGVVWASVNILPWFAAFEVAKRRSGPAERWGIVAAAFVASMLLHWLLEATAHGLWHELARRVPGLLTVASLLLLVSAPDGRMRRPSSPLALPLPPSRIDWVSAAGNYVELHGAGGVVIHRAALSAVEGELGAFGFVRIHRSTLVRRDAVARVRTVDLLLHDGTSLKLGGRYRAALRRVAGETRPFVPAE